MSYLRRTYLFEVDVGVAELAKEFEVVQILEDTVLLYFLRVLAEFLELPPVVGLGKLAAIA